MVVVASLLVLLPVLAVASLALAPAVIFVAATCGAFSAPRPQNTAADGSRSPASNLHAVDYAVFHRLSDTSSSKVTATLSVTR